MPIFHNTIFKSCIIKYCWSGWDSQNITHACVNIFIYCWQLKQLRVLTVVLLSNSGCTCKIKWNKKRELLSSKLNCINIYYIWILQNIYKRKNPVIWHIWYIWNCTSDCYMVVKYHLQLSTCIYNPPQSDHFCIQSCEGFLPCISLIKLQTHIALKSI